MLIKNYDMSNVELMVISSCSTASNEDGTGTNLCIAAYEQGAKCVLGWAEPIYFDDIEAWQRNFQEKLSQGWPIADAVRYANSFLYIAHKPEICIECEQTYSWSDGYISCECGATYGRDIFFYDPSTIKTTRIYGDGDIVIASNSTDILDYGETYVDFRYYPHVTPQYDMNNMDSILDLVFYVFDVSDADEYYYAPLITYTSEDGDDYIIDFIQGESAFRMQPGQMYGYTVIVEDNAIVGMRNNRE